MCATKEQNTAQAKVKDLRLYDVQGETHESMHSAFRVQVRYMICSQHGAVSSKTL